MGQPTQPRVDVCASPPFLTPPPAPVSLSARIFPLRTTVNALLSHLILITTYKVDIVTILRFKGVEIELQMTCPRLHS